MYQQDRAWEGSYQDQVLAILNTQMHHLVELAIASDYKDRKQATDFVVKMKGGDIAVRLRRPRYEQRDWTIRARRDNGTKTELAKIREGYGSHYFYGWTDELHGITEWILIDLNKARASGLLTRDWVLIANKDLNGRPDGTYFIAIPASVLRDAGCLLDWRCPILSRQVNLYVSPNEGLRRAEHGYSARGIPRRDLEIINTIGSTLQSQAHWDDHPDEREQRGREPTYQQMRGLWAWPQSSQRKK